MFVETDSPAFNRRIVELLIFIKNYLAHSPTEAHPEGQPLKEHLENVSHLSFRFGEAFDAMEDGRLCGLYHDIGKYSEAFQRRLSGSKMQVDHSSSGALLLFETQNFPASMCIAGHHAGLADRGTKNDLSDTFTIGLPTKTIKQRRLQEWTTKVEIVFPNAGGNDTGRKSPQSPRKKAEKTQKSP